MTGIRFYEVFTDQTKRTSAGNAIAVFFLQWREGPAGLRFDAVLGLTGRPNSPVVTSSVSAEYLRTHCRIISESRARRIHSNLFRALEGR